MKFYLAIKYHSDNVNRLLIEAICSVLEKRGDEIAHMARDHEQWGKVSFSPEELMKKTFQEIDQCDVLLVEFSEKGVGVGMEIGYAHAKGKPVYVVAKKGSDISKTVEGVAQKILWYSSFDDLPTALNTL